jgi:DNA repair exonuclease SbcCD nuclease subunit
MTINQPRVAIISDLHLGVHTNSNSWHNIALEWANWFKSELIKNDIKDIIFCGDWHHNRSEISVNTLQVSADILNILKDFNLLLITGNHDMYFKNRTDVHSLSIFKNRKNVTIIEETTQFTCFGKSIAMVPWNCKLDKIGKCDVMFGHFEIESFEMNSYKICDHGLNISEVISKADLIVSGHFHKRSSKKFGDSEIVYIGNPFQMDFGDEGDQKGYYIFDIRDNNLSFVENNISPVYKKIALSYMAKEKQITDKLREQFRGNFVKVDIDMNICQEHLDFLVAYLSKLNSRSLSINHNVSFNKIKNNSENINDFSGIDMEQAIVEFINLLEIENKKDIIDYTLDLYHKCAS